VAGNNHQKSGRHRKGNVETGKIVGILPKIRKKKTLLSLPGGERDPLNRPKETEPFKKGPSRSPFGPCQGGKGAVYCPGGTKEREHEKRLAQKKPASREKEGRKGLLDSNRKRNHMKWVPSRSGKARFTEKNDTCRQASLSHCFFSRIKPFRFGNAKKDPA